MAEYTASIQWARGAAEAFVDQRYSRGHEWVFDGGVRVPASSSPHVVPLPYSVEANVDPEEAFVASLSSCHMLFFLAIAAQQGFVVESYVDNAVGVMEKGSDGKIAMTQVTLRPKAVFAGEPPSMEALEQIHHAAHEKCFIANSVKTDVVTEIQH
ncbi:OsmC family protein [Halomonas meridiana]|uniref:OsmC family protein n=1 Tax=Vreelandella aquamarina TaxID=77097 RepID=UPI00273CCBC1|nr:OsmC family protein [Halomonas meridiana]MDP4559296.1 OsmC family protein [Halomonas meridiana]